MVIRMRFDGKVFIPEGPVDLPVNEPLEAEFRAVSGRAEGRKRAREAWKRFKANSIEGRSQK